MRTLSQLRAELSRLEEEWVDVYSKRLALACAPSTGELEGELEALWARTVELERATEELKKEWARYTRAHSN